MESTCRTCVYIYIPFTKHDIVHVVNVATGLLVLIFVLYVVHYLICKRVRVIILVPLWIVLAHVTFGHAH